MHITNRNYEKTIETSANAKQVFTALTNDLCLWWGETKNSKFELDGKFTIEFKNGYWWTFEVSKYIYEEELVWECIDGEPLFNKEWIGHTLHWRIEKGKAEFSSIWIEPLYGML